MRVAITGAHGVGKSTLAARLCEALNLPELPTPGRTLAAMGMPVNEQATVVSQTVAWLLQFRFERETPAWVASRCLVDVWAYTAQAATRDELDQVGHTLMAELAHVTRLVLADAYDTLIYVPPRLPLVADDVRQADERFQRNTDERIRQVLAEWEVPHLELDVRDQSATEALIEDLSRRLRAPDSPPSSAATSD